MKRSNLTTKYMIGVVAKYEKAFKEKYKKENNESFNGNVINYLTLGVIQRKKLPDIEDVISLIKLGNVDCTDEQADQILTRWLEDDENKARGVAGAFCDLCKDLCIDIPYNKAYVDQVNKLEESINSTSSISNKLLEILQNLQSTNIKNDDDNVSDNNIEDDKEKA